MLRRVWAAVLAAGIGFGLVAPACAHEAPAERPPWAAPSAWPDRIVLTFAADPARSLAVSWRTESGVTAARAQIVKASADARFDLVAATAPAVTEAVDLATVLGPDEMRHAVRHNAGLAPVSYHSVLFEGLSPDTLYAYRVEGAQGRWSEWLQARTAPLSGPIRFIYVGDAQNGIHSHWARTVRAAFAKAPDARFILHAGDLVNIGSRDYEWAQWFKAVGFIHGMTPAVPVAGNHEYPRLTDDPNEQRRILSLQWRPQFRLPEVAGLPAHLRETVYDVRYSQDLHVFVLDTQGGELEAQARWLDAGLKASDARWKVAAFHHPVFSSGRDRDDKARRAVLLPVLRANDIDLVLQGHDHTYARGALSAGGQTPERTSGKPRASGAVGPMFVNSVSGAKQYVWRDNRWDDYAEHGVKLDRRAENTQFFQVIGIDGDRLTYEAFTADGQLYDGFALRKDEKGRRRMIAGPASTMDERTFANTGKYDGADPLND